MSTSYFFCLLSVVALLATGCEKEKLESCPGHCTAITGRLVTAGGSQGLSGATVTAVWDRNRGIFGGSSQDKARAVTDAAGNYQLTFFVKDEELKTGFFEVVFAVDPKRYFTIGDESIAFFTLKRDTTYQASPYLIPYKATVNLTVPNPDQITGYYAIDFNSPHGYTLIPSLTTGGGTHVSVAKQSAPYSTTIEVAANQRLYLQTTKALNGTYLRTLDSLVIPAGTTRTITVTY